MGLIRLSRPQLFVLSRVATADVGENDVWRNGNRRRTFESLASQELITIDTVSQVLVLTTLGHEVWLREKARHAALRGR